MPATASNAADDRTIVGKPRAEESAQFIRQVHEIVRDLMRPSLPIFFTDFLLTIGLAYAATAVYLTAEAWSLAQLAAFFVAGTAMYRAAIFIHELEHRPPGSFRAFTFTWNALCGVPFFMPSFLYDNHVDHHSQNTYGTQGDSEYLSLARRPRAVRAFLFATIGLLDPVLGPLRFLLLTPWTFASSKLDHRIWTQTSSLYMLNPQYRRKYDASARSAARWTMEVVCCATAWTWVVLIWNGVVPLAIVGKVYLLFAAWMAVNQLRTLTAHRYESLGDPSSYAEQLLDSNTFDRGPWAELWAPVGLRYHALHHVMPSLPYHAMGEAHRRLLRELPSDSPYRRTLRPGFAAALREAFLGGA